MKKNEIPLFWVEETFEWYEGAMVFRVFIFYLFIFFCLETTVIENNWMRTTSVAVMVFFFRKYHSESTWSQLYSKFFLNSYEAPWQLHLKDTLQMKILRTWIIIGVEASPRHLTYYCMLLFLSNKPSFSINLVLIE